MPDNKQTLDRVKKVLGGGRRELRSIVGLCLPAPSEAAD